jgi:hypothetical protein
MSNFRDEDARLYAQQLDYIQHSTFTLTSFSDDWGSELAGALAFGPHKDIKLLEEAALAHGFALCESRTVYRQQIRKQLPKWLAGNPRGYLVVAFAPAAMGVRLLRFTMVTQIGVPAGGPYGLLVSAPNGAFVELDQHWFGASKIRQLSKENLFGSEAFPWK